MATDMQALSNAFPSHHAPAVQDARDRQPTFQGADASRNFESVLGRAEARRMPAKHDVPTPRNVEKPGPHARQVARSTQDSSDQRSDRSAISEADDQTVTRGERAAENAQQSADDSEEKDGSREAKKDHHAQDTAPQELVLAAMIVPTAPAPPVEQPSPQAGTGKTPSEIAATAVASASTTRPLNGATPGIASLPSASAPDAATPGVPEREPGSTVATGKETALSKPTAEQEMASIAGQIPAPEETLIDRTDSDAGNRIDTDHLNSALAAMTATKHNPKMAEQSPIDQGDRSTILDALAQGASVHEGSAGASTGHFLEQSGQGLSDSHGETDHSLPNQTPSVEQNARPAFMDRMNDLHQGAPSVSESSFSRSESGQTAAVLRASESERVSDLRGMAPVSQSVTLDLDPLDMGPLRVRVMMSDQTVHAHIRTEHGELGQGLLQQGQSLESSLRTTGLEMGMLRVTVDQQQGRGDNAWMFQQQQQQGRPSSTNMSQAAAPEDQRAVSGERGVASNERVSFFA